MYIKKATIKNFRLLLCTELIFRKNLSLLIGRNNTAKTSFLVLFEKFFNANNSFKFDDFSTVLREEINNIDIDTNVDDLSIQLILEIVYEGSDDLSILSEFILDLDPSENIVRILFECTIDKNKILLDLEKTKLEKTTFIRKYLSRYLKKRYFAFSAEEDIETENRHKLIKKELDHIKALINFQIIHAKRDVASSEGERNVLSRLTTQYFNKTNKPEDAFDPINNLMTDMDKNLEEKYESFFDSFLLTSKDFFQDMKDLKVISDLQSNAIIQNSSQVVYGENEDYLPETFNGLGYMNMLFLLLQIEIKKETFEKDDKCINFLFIEEPEAHTHPQMQYIFAKKIKTLLKEIKNLQTTISTHSAHIVSQCDFKDIRYLLKKENYFGKQEYSCVIIKNFYNELEEKYEEPDQFKFLEQYLTLQSSELFFADKIIFIEGITEKILLPYFINQYDSNNKEDPSYKPLLSQNLTIVEVGANAKVFRHFLAFLNVKTLIITDIDTTQKHTGKQTTYKACKVSKDIVDNTSNQTLKYYFNAPDIGSQDFKDWMTKIIDHTQKCIHPQIHVAYQKEDGGFHGRSFEDAFISKNIDTVKKKVDLLNGLKNKSKLNEIDDFYDLTIEIIDKKSDFASSLLYLALSNDDVTWEMPKYIEEGLSWIAK